MIAAEQRGDADERRVGEGPLRVRRDRRLAGDVRQHLATALVEAQIARRAAETDLLEMLEQRFGRFARRAPRAPDGVPDARDAPDVCRPAGEHHLVLVRRLDPHDNSSRPSAREVWVIKSVTKPPRTAARTAAAFELP